jgi:hypothetical protein
MQLLSQPFRLSAKLDQKKYAMELEAVPKRAAQWLAEPRQAAPALDTASAPGLQVATLKQPAGALPLGVSASES